MKNQKTRVALSSVFGSIFLTIIKLIVGMVTGSMGIISEAAHSGLDLIAALITYFAVSHSDKPADATHNYGHGKIENISAFIETLLLIATSFWIIYEAIKRLNGGTAEIEVAWYSFAVMGLSIIVDFSRSRALYKVAKETNSQALEADALHFHSDIYSSSVVILGLILYLFGVKGADSIAALGVAVFVLHAAYRLGKRTIEQLLDKAPEGMDEKIKIIASKVDGVAGISRIRARQTGASIFIDMTINISRNISFENVEKITKTVQEKVKRSIKNADVVVHVKPIAIQGETVIERIKTIVVNHGYSAHNISVHNAGDKTFINFDLEVLPSLTLKNAHQIASHIEESIKTEVDSTANINIHIEPRELSELASKDVRLNDIQKINLAIGELKDKIKAINDIHNISVHRIDKKIFISLHCVFDGKISIGNAHNLSTKMEETIKQSLPNIERVIVHVEPKSVIKNL